MGNAMKIYVPNLFNILIRADSRKMELYNVLSNLWWLIVILQPGDLFAVPSFAGLHIFLGSEYVLAVILFSTVILHGTGLLANNILLRFISSSFQTFIWSTITASVLLSSGVLTGFGIYGLLAVFSFSNSWALSPILWRKIREWREQNEWD